MEKVIAWAGSIGLLSIFLLVIVPFAIGILLFSKPAWGKRALPVLSISTSVMAGLMLSFGGSSGISVQGFMGVDLLLDSFAWTFVLMNGLVFSGVLLSIDGNTLPPFAYPLMALLHGTANAVFFSHDLFNVFVCIELASILAFLLIRIGKKPRQAWSAVQYLITGNVGMILYLLGCLYAYNRSGSFSMDVLGTLSGLPLFLLVAGLCVKGGVFLMGLWLPEAHGEAESAVSALLSGVVVKTGIAPLLRIASLSPSASGIISVIAVMGAIFGVSYAVFEKNVKKMLAYHTLSQTGFMLVVPGLGHLYAFAHGLFKSWLFISVGKLDSKDIRELRKKGVEPEIWGPIFLGAMAISGLPGLGAFGAKTRIFADLSPWQVPLMYLAAMGTCISFAKLVFLPVLSGNIFKGLLKRENSFFLLCLVIFDLYTGYFNVPSIIKAFLIIAVGWGLYYSVLRKSYISLPKWPEELVNIIGFTLLCILVMMGMMES